jgi:hypothetical protein
MFSIVKDQDRLERAKRSIYDKELSASLEEWFAFLESIKGVRLRSEELTSRDLRSSFPVGTVHHLATRHSMPGLSSRACARGYRSFPLILCGIRPRRCCSTNEEPTYVTCRLNLDIRVWPQQRVTLTSSIPSGFAHWSATSGSDRFLQILHRSQI